MNVPDHDMTFQSLSDLLQESVTPFAVSVQAKECAGVPVMNFVSKVIFVAFYMKFNKEAILCSLSSEESDAESIRKINRCWRVSGR